MTKKAPNKRIGKTFTLQKITIDAIERRAKESNTNASNLADSILRKVLLDDAEYFRALEKHHLIKSTEARYMAKRAEDKKLGV